MAVRTAKVIEDRLQKRDSESHKRHVEKIAFVKQVDDVVKRMKGKQKFTGVNDRRVILGLKCVKAGTLQFSRLSV